MSFKIKDDNILVKYNQILDRIKNMLKIKTTVSLFMMKNI